MYLLVVLLLGKKTTLSMHMHFLISKKGASLAMPFLIQSDFIIDQTGCCMLVLHVQAK